MRLFLGIVLLFFCLFVGYCVSGKYYFRRLFYTDFLNFNTVFGHEIAFKQTTIIDILKNQTQKSDFFVLLNDFVLKQKKEFDCTYLTNQEKSFVYEYLEKLGRFDKETQLEYIRGVNEIIVEKHQNSILDEKKYKTLYIKLSFLIGLILLIIVL